MVTHEEEIEKFAKKNVFLIDRKIVDTKKDPH